MSGIKETALTRARIPEVADERQPKSNITHRLSPTELPGQSKNVSVASRLSRRGSDEIEEVQPRQINRISVGFCFLFNITYF